MITLGNDEEKKILAEEMLTDVWLEALDRATQTPDFADVKKEVKKILTEIRKSKSVKNIKIKTACIILQISCTLPSDMLNIINYFDSTEFLDVLVNISNELGYYFNTAFSVYSVIPIECLMGVINCQHDPAQPEEGGIRLPITVSSPAGMLQLRSLFNSEKIANSTNAISDALSRHLDERITLKVCTDLKVLDSVFDEDNTSTDSCSDSSSSENTLAGSIQLQHFDEHGENPNELSTKNFNEVPVEESTAEDPMELTEGHKHLHKLASQIRNSQISGETHRLVPQATECVHSFVDTFNKEGNAVLAQHEALVSTKCPKRVEVENLSKSLNSFRLSLQKGNDKAAQLRTKIHDAVESIRCKKNRNENQIYVIKKVITSLEGQIEQKDTAIKEYEENAIRLDQYANELTDRARRLRSRSDQPRAPGFAGDRCSFGVGLLFAPFTGGAGALVSGGAGVGVKINFDLAEDCDRNANLMRSKARDKRDEALRQRMKKYKLESEQRKKRNEIQVQERAIGQLAEICNALDEQEGYILRSIETIGQATIIVQDFESALHILSSLRGDAFELLQKCFIEDPGEFHAEEMMIMKDKCNELEGLILKTLKIAEQNPLPPRTTPPPAPFDKADNAPPFCKEKGLICNVK